jgi:uncharacterized protein YegP (UPF0339 family)
MDAWFEIFKDDVGEYRFRLTVESVGGDEITATSEGYTAKHNAVKGIETGGRWAAEVSAISQQREPAVDRIRFANATEKSLALLHGGCCLASFPWLHR